MAIVFISPQKKQRAFLITVGSLSVLVLFILSLITFLPKIESSLKSVPESGQSNVPDIKINFEAADSGKVKNMELIKGVEKEFNYTAQGKDNKQTTGTIFALNASEAQEFLAAMGFKNFTIKEVGAGRINPFAP